MLHFSRCKIDTMAKKKKLEEKKEGPTSLFILRESNLIRRLTKFLIEWPPFEYTVLLTIIANCVVLAIERPLPNGDKTELARQLVSEHEQKQGAGLCFFQFRSANCACST